MFNDQSRIQRLSCPGFLNMRTVVSVIGKSHHWDLPVIRGIRKNLLTIRRADNKAERYSMFATGTNCCIVDRSTVEQCNF